MNVLGFILIGLVGLLLVMVYQKLSVLSKSQAMVDEEKAKALVNQVFGEMAEKVVAQTKQVLQGDKEAIFNFSRFLSGRRLLSLFNTVNAASKSCLLRVSYSFLFKSSYRFFTSTG